MTPAAEADWRLFRGDGVPRAVALPCGPAVAPLRSRRGRLYRSCRI